MKRVETSRKVAYDVLTAVRVDDAYANLVLPVRLRRAGLSGSDAAFATELTYGTLRMQGFYDSIIAHAASRPVRKIDKDVLDALRLGSHQLLSMTVAAHAAVNETVALVDLVTRGRAVGFANAVLRAVGRRDIEQWRAYLAERAGSDTVRRAVLYSHPRWVINALDEALAADDRTGELDALLAANNEPAPVTLAVYDGSAPSGATPAAYSPYAWHLSGGDPATALKDAAGHVRVQDEGSQLCALVLARARAATPDESWLDLCAGPGGKSALLAFEARAVGAHLVANEAVPARADLVRTAVAPFEDTVEVRTGDGRLIGTECAEAFDRVLVDVPCTGLGALRRRPEARWRRSAADLTDLTELQAELLDSAIRAAKPGGLVAYVTCSPHVEETRRQVDRALERYPGALSLVDAGEIAAGTVRGELPGMHGPVLQLWPHAHGTDAMFLALMTVTRSVG